MLWTADPGLALDENVVAGPPLILAASPALVRRDLAYLIAEIGPRGRVPRGGAGGSGWP